MVWCIANDCDLARARSLHMDVKFPLLEHWVNSKGMMSKVIRQKGARSTKMFAMLHKNPEIIPLAKSDTTAIMRKTPKTQRRFVKTHIFFSLLPPRLLDTCKVRLLTNNLTYHRRSVVVWFTELLFGYHSVLVEYLI